MPLRVIEGDGPEVVDGYVVQWRLHGRRHRVSPLTPVDAAADVPFEDAVPARDVRRWKGQTSTVGYSWFETARKQVVFESWFEHQQITHLDFDPTVTTVSSQPFWLFWQGPTRVHSHAPDLFVRYIDGTAKVINCRPAHRIKDKDAAVFATMQKACERAGWGYETVTAINEVEWANVDWLSRYRRPLHPRVQRYVDPLIEVCQEPISIERAAVEVGTPMLTMPVLYHLLWQRVLTCPTLTTYPFRFWTRVHSSGFGTAAIEEETT